MAKVPSIRQVFFYRAPPSRVFAALTEPSELAKWFPEEAEVELEKGGKFRLRFAGGFEMRGKVKKAKAPTRLSVNWIDRLEKGKTFKTSAEFRLEAKNGGTLLTLNHTGFGSGKPWVYLYGAIQSGWAYYLTNLRSVLEHSTDLRSEHDAVSGT